MTQKASCRWVDLFAGPRQGDSESFILAIIGLQAWAVVDYRDDWPFASNSMFSFGRRSANGSWTGLGRKVPVWPARLILVVLALIYFSSGYAKLRETGIEWGDGKTLQSYATDPQPAPYFLQDPDADREAFRDLVGLESFLYSSGTPTSLLRTLAGNDLVMAMIATASLLWWLTFPLPIFVRRLLPWYLGVGVAFHMIVALTFKLYSFPLCYLVFVDWTRVVGYARSWWSGRNRASAMSESGSTPT